MCFGGRKTHEERKIWLKVRLFGFSDMLVTDSAPTVKYLASSSTLIGPFGRSHALPSSRWLGVGHKHIRKAEEANLKPNFSFFTSLSTIEAHVCGVKFIRLYGTVVFVAIRDFSF